MPPSHRWWGQFETMNLKLTWETAAKAAGGVLSSGDPRSPFDSFVTDTRNSLPGQVFWALKGRNHDAHLFLETTLKSGASGWVIENGRGDSCSARPPHVIEAADTLKALQALAAFHRNRLGLRLAAITGSNGKSTTKEMLRYICSKAGNTCANPGNLNNQFGLPLSILELDPAHEYGVFELGASKEGDIQEIGIVARPDVAVLTNVSAAHLEFFRDIETVYRTKTELTRCLKPGGTLVYNADDSHLSRLDRQWKGNRVTFGFSKNADVRVAEGAGGVRLIHKGEQRLILPDSTQKYNRYNAAAAAAAATALGIGWEKIVSGFADFKPLPMRMQLEKIGDAVILLDAYNANPESMRAAVSSLIESGLPSPRCVILGDMKELGDYSKKYHEELGDWLASLPLDMIFLAGIEMKAAADSVSTAGGSARLVYAESPDEWTEKLKEKIKKGGTYLLKASRAMQFEKILKKI